MDTTPRLAGEPLRVVVSMDVEEEGLFSGHYRRHGCTVSNVQRLPDLAPLADDLGFPLTLFCSYAVFEDAAACRVLERMRDRHGCEIAAHLHHWSTPPFEDGSDGGEAAAEGTAKVPTRTDRLPRELLAARLASLLEIGRRFQSAPLTSFRMGRWDLKRTIFPLLAEQGITADSSICPLRRFSGGADHFLAPATPYWPLGSERGLLEVPVTQIPLLPFLPKAWHALLGRSDLCDRFHFLAALSANPFWHGDAVMRLAVRLAMARGLPVLCVFWHSSELMPGASPHVPDEAAAKRVLGRIRDFFAWLRGQGNVEGVTLAQLRHLAGDRPERLAERPNPEALEGDW